MFKVPVFIDTVFKLVLSELHKAYQHFRLRAASVILEPLSSVP